MSVSPTSLVMFTHSPWNQSSHPSHWIIHRWSSGPRHTQYGPWSDSSDPESPSAASSSPSSSGPAAVGDEAPAPGAAFFFLGADLVFLPPPALPFLGALTAVAVPFFLR